MHLVLDDSITAIAFLSSITVVAVFGKIFGRVSCTFHKSEPGFIELSE